MNRFGLGERVAPQPLVEDHESRHHPLLTLAYLHWWDKGTRVPADIAARLIEEGYDVEAQTQQSFRTNILMLTSRDRMRSHSIWAHTVEKRRPIFNHY